MVACLIAIDSQRINTRGNRHTHPIGQINEFLIEKHYQITWVYAAVIIYVL